MRRTWGLLSVGTLLFLTACSGEPAPAPPPAPPSTSASKATSTTPTTPPPPASPAKITAACPFLPLTEVQQIMGDTIYGSKEGQQEAAVKEKDGITDYACHYNRSDGFYLSVVAEQGWSVPSMAAETKKECTKPPTPLPDIGETAWFCDGKDQRVTTVVYKRAHGQIRVALVDISGPTRSDVYETIAKRLAERL
ncbi:hypothetical protein [Amycolatopsis sp. BJA-103]|uniref:hypothetical protein n=1 Tax=Amycolatopsis sp. BJA-103 TaxID=1911175 RepID=UPI0011AEE80E|nr:hypothetical protein [Amycolatopsis sp. BJA-103]